MAERTIILNAKVNTGNSAKDLKDVDKAVKDYQRGTKAADKSTNDLNATFEDVYGDMKPLSARLGELEDRMYELALAGNENTKEFKELQREAVKYRKTIIQTDKAVDSFAESGRGIGTALQLSETVVAGYQGFVGVTALLGDENEELLETITKLQAAQGVLSSLEQIRLATTKKSVIVTRGQAAGTAALSAVQSVYAAVVGTSTGALKAFRIALIATGIGAIVVLIGLLVSYWDDLVGWVKDSVKWFQNLSPEIKNVLRVIFPFIAAIEGIGAAWDYLFGETKKLTKEQEKAARQLKKNIDAQKKQVAELQQIYEEEKKINDQKIEAIDFELRKRRAAGKETSEMEMEKLRLIVESVKKEMAIRRVQAREYVKQLEMQNNHLLNFAKTHGITTDQIIDNLGTIDEEYKNMESELETTLQDIEIMEIEMANERNENAKKAAEKRKSIEGDLYTFLEGIRNRMLSDEQQKLIQLTENQNQELTELQSYLDSKQLTEEEYYKERNRIVEFYENQRKEIESSFAEPTTGSELEVQEDKDPAEDFEFQYERSLAEKIFNVKKGYAERTAEFNKMTDQERAKNFADAEKMRIDMAANSFGAIMDISKAFAGDSEKEQKRAFKIQKAAGIAQALVQTYQAAQGAYLSQISVPTPDAPVRASIAAGIATATGLANVASIASQKFQGGGSSGGGGGSSSRSGGSSFTSGEMMPQADSINLFGQANENQINLGDNNDSDNNNNQNITVTAQVVESEITTAQNNSSTVESRFSL